MFDEDTVVKKQNVKHERDSSSNLSIQNAAGLTTGVARFITVARHLCLISYHTWISRQEEISPLL